MKTWLPIKHDYLIENFDSLLQYLAEADYEQKDDFLRETIEKLGEVARTLLDERFSHRLGVEDPKDEEWMRNVKIVAAAVIATARIGRDGSALLVGLIDTLVVNRVVVDEVYMARIKDILLMLAAGRPVRRFPYTLGDLASPGFNPSIFSKQLAGITFYDSEVPYRLTYEGRGVCEFENRQISIIPFAIPPGSPRSKLKKWAEVSFGVVLLSEEKKKPSDLDFKEQVTLLNRITQSLSNVVPEPPKVLKTYGPDDTFFVEVIEISNVPGREWVVCRSIDPGYNVVERTLYLPFHHQFNPYVSVPRGVFMSHVSHGTRLKVGMAEVNGRPFFSIKDTLEEYYTDISGLSEAEVAIFRKDYTGGTSWLTELGKLVNVMRDPADEEIREAEDPDGDKAIEIVYRNVRNNRQGFPVINAERVGSVVSGVDHGEFMKEVQENIVKDVLEYWNVECPQYVSQYIDLRKLPAVYVSTLCHLLAAMGDDLDLPHYERYMDFVAATFLAVMLGDAHDTAYCEFSLGYLRALWAFAQDSGHEWLRSLPVPESLAGLPAVERGHRVVGILAGYREAGYQIMTTLDNEVDVSRVDKLVDASNTLIGNISVSEISRIKRTICQCLGIESICKEIASGKESLGDESETVEFKTSIVFPPSRRGHESPDPDPNVQIWAILRTINGFLNTVHGGTLYIGVNNFGMYTGVEQDMEWLYDRKDKWGNRLLFSPDIDHYMQYVKLRVDNAFKACRRSDADREITSTRISYTSFRKEEATVLRVDVSPYELGCVKLKEVISLPGGGEVRRPAAVGAAYIRMGTSTEPLSDRMREKVEADKRSVIKDSEKQSHISVQDAIENSRYILLRDYQSASGASDRTVEPLELLPLRGLVVGKEKGSREVRVFKLGRCAGVEVTDEVFKPSAARHNYSVDPFNMLSASDKKTFRLRLRLDRLAWLLLRESYPYAEQYLSEAKDDTDYPYLLDCEISDERGIGAFCMSVLGHFRVIDTPRLDLYLREQTSNPKW